MGYFPGCGGNLRVSSFFIANKITKLNDDSLLHSPRFLDCLSFSFSPPKSSAGYVAGQVMASEFPIQSTLSNIVVLVTNKVEGLDVNEDELKAFEISLGAALANFTVAGYEHVLQNYFSYYTLPDLNNPTQQALLKDQLIHNNKTALINIDYRAPDIVFNGSPPEIDNLMVEFIIDQTDKLNPPSSSLKVVYTGLPVFVRDMKIGVEVDMIKVDGFTAPLALVILMFMLGSVRIMIIPFINIITIFLGSFLVMYPVATYMSVASFAPSLMMSTIIALSVDYSLFLLSRFREERDKGVEPLLAVEVMMQHAGHNVFISGCTIFIAFLGLVFCPLDMLSSVGIGTAVAIFFTIGINLIMTTVWLLTFPDFFGSFWNRKNTRKSLDSEINKPLKSLDDLTDDDSTVFSPFYTALAKCNIKFRWIIVVLVVALAAPTAPYAFNYKRTDSVASITPRGSVSQDGFDLLTKTFGAGVTQPINIIMVTNSTIFSDDFFTNSQAFLDEFALKMPNITGSDGSSVRVKQDAILGFVSSTQSTPEFFIKNILDAPPPYDPEIVGFRTLLVESYNRYVSSNNCSTFVDIRLPVDPMSPEGEEWLKESRKVLSDIIIKYKTQSDSVLGQWIAANSVEFYLGGSSVIIYDAIQAVYNYFPIMVLVTCLIVFVLVSFAFQSIVVSLRAVFTIAITISIVYATGNWTYTAGMLNWMHLPGLSNQGAISWVVPVLQFCVLVGLGLDYDIFLLSRIAEYRDKGYSADESIIHGLDKTGHIITAAGLIMAVAFGGLLFSSISLLNECSYYLVAAVLLDTFLVRTIMVPAIMAILGDVNWWPKYTSFCRKNEEVGNGKDKNYLSMPN